jgi:hypothetical protein
LEALPVSTSWLKLFFWVYLLFLVWAAATAVNPADPDLWHRLAVGEYICNTRHFPTGETFSYLASYQEIADHEWGSGIIFYGLWSHGGGVAIVLAKIITLAVTLTLIVWAGKGDRRPTLLVMAFYAVILLALLPSFQSTLRCMAFTHLIFALWVYLWQRERRGLAALAWVYPLTMIAWANLHGGFVIGLLWLALLTMLELAWRGDWKKWGVRFALCALATLVNPYGWHLWYATGRALLTTRLGFPEWAPVPWAADPLSYLGYKILLLGTVPALAYVIYRRGWRNVDQRGVILVVASLVIFESARNTSLVAIVAGAILPGFLHERMSFSTMQRPLRRLTYLCFSAGLALFPLFAAIMTLPQSALLTLDYPGNSCPVDAVAFLEGSRVQGNLLVPFNYGSYALWELRGKMRVSMDGRYDLVYSPATYQRVHDFFSAKGDWQALLTSPAPQAVLVPRLDRVFDRLMVNPAWTEAWHDRDDAVFLPK